MTVQAQFRNFQALPRFVCASCLLFAFASKDNSVLAADTVAVSFSREIVPLLTRSGCNTGACHGAAAGRGYLRLSLFGSRPQDDFESLLHSGGGRLVDLSDPEQSLLLLKPSEQVEHGGGERLEAGGQAYSKLLTWIQHHAPPDALQPVAELDVQQGNELTITLNSTAKLKVGALWGDEEGEQAQFRSDVICVDGAGEGDAESLDSVTFERRGDHLLLTGHRVGYWPVTVRVGAVAKAVGIWVSPAQIPPQENQESDSASARMDLIAAEYARRAGVEPSKTCSSTLLVRRLWIDLLGRHPTEQEWSIAVRRIDAGEKMQLVDELLSSDDFYRHCAAEISTWVTDASVGKYARSPSRLRDAIKNHLSASDDMRALVQGMLRVPSVGAAQPLNEFHQFASDPRQRTELVADVWMGVQMGCAKCHDHPLDSWTQDDYFSMSACWAPIQTGDRVKRLPSRTTTDLRTELPAVAALPKPALTHNFDSNRTSPIEADDHAFVAWLVATDNPYFENNISNRIWAWLIGDGLVSPVNDFRSTNPPIAPVLLEHLNSVFRSSQNSIRAVVRCIVLSDTYSRDSSAETERLARVLGASRKPKKIAMSAVELTEQVFGSSGVSSAGDSDGPETMMMSVDRDGCTRAAACDDPLSDRLRLVTGEDLAAEIRKGIVKMLGSSTAPDPIELLSALHTRVFGIPASNRLQATWRQLLVDNQEANASPSETFRGQEVVEAIFWGWIVSGEFRALH